MKIAEREVLVVINGTKSTVPIIVFAPTRANADYACTYEIHWPDGVERGAVLGIDSMQALQLTFQQIGISLYSSDYHERGQLMWERPGNGYGFPLPSNARDLLIGEDARFF